MLVAETIIVGLWSLCKPVIGQTVGRLARNRRGHLSSRNCCLYPTGHSRDVADGDCASLLYLRDDTLVQAEFVFVDLDIAPLSTKLGLILIEVLVVLAKAVLVGCKYLFEVFVCVLLLFSKGLKLIVELPDLFSL